MITILEAIKLSTEYLEKKNVESPRTNAEILLADVLKCKRLELYLSFDKPLKENELNIYREYIRKRGLRIPMQYIIGNVEFYGLNLFVDENVLIPRPETELLVEQIITENQKEENLDILDIGTGSGNIPIALAKNLNEVKITSIDISEKALDVARKNSEVNNTVKNIEFKLFNIMTDSINQFGKFDIIVSNPPYVSEEDYQKLEPELKVHEPVIALTDYANGLSFYSKIIEISGNLLKPSGRIYFEVGADQSKSVYDMFVKHNFRQIKIIKDYSGIERIITGVIEWEH